jgi:thymidine kinase
MTLSVILGCMYAGKTETVISYARRYKAINKKVLFINHQLDDRYSDSNKVVSHNGTSEDCIKVSNLMSARDTQDFKEASVIVIEEAQFFQDLLEFFKTINVSSKHFIVSGLAGDYRMNPIGDILSLIPMAEYVEKINGFCIYCKDGTIGAFTKKKKGSDDKTIEVGGLELYECVCRNHFKD